MPATQPGLLHCVLFAACAASATAAFSDGGSLKLPAPLIAWTRRGAECLRCANATAYVTRDLLVAGRRLIVIDNVVSSEAATPLFEALSGLRYRLNDVDGPESSYIKHWKHDLPTHLPWSHPAMQPHGSFISALWVLAAAVAGDQRIRYGITLHPS